MQQSQSRSPNRQRRIFQVGHSLLLRRHPVLTPIVLLCGSILLGTISLFSDPLLPTLVFIEVSSNALYLSIAFVLGISGILASIISIIEHIDRYCIQTAMFPKPKEHSYDRN